MKTYITDPTLELIPAGVYSISMRLMWRDPFAGRNGPAHIVLKIQKQTSHMKLAKHLAQWASKTREPAGKCHHVTITSISRLDIGLTIRSGCDIME